jgi:hypothetical protein
MLIRSQNKEILVNIETSIVFYISGVIGKKYPIFASNGYAIGLYSTKVKAMKVLDMIQKRYEECETERIYKEGIFKIGTFQMPEDSEVEA